MHIHQAQNCIKQLEGYDRLKLGMLRSGLCIFIGPRGTNISPARGSAQGIRTTSTEKRPSGQAVKPSKGFIRC